MDIKALYDEFAKLPLQEQRRFYNRVYSHLIGNNSSESDFAQEIRESRFSDGLHCPHCKGTIVIRHGKYRGRQRYLCKDCNKTFNDMTCTPLSGTHYPGKWLDYIEYMVKGYTLFQIAEILEVHISTAFFWRHKVLNAIRLASQDELSGIIESDETYFLESHKGSKDISFRLPRKRGGTAVHRGISHEQVSVVVAIDRNGKILSKIAGYGRVDKHELDTVLGSYIAPDSCLCTDSAKNYASFAELRHLKHEVINISKGIRVHKGIYHVQHVNAYHSHLKSWIGRFKGVATKYLDNYLAWFRYLELQKPISKEQKKYSMLIDCSKVLVKTLTANLRPCLQV